MITWLMAQPLWFVLLVWVATLFAAVMLVSLVCDCIKQFVAAKQLRILQERLVGKEALDGDCNPPRPPADA